MVLVIGWILQPGGPSSTVTMERRRSAPTCMKAERMFMDVDPMILELGDSVDGNRQSRAKPSIAGRGRGEFVAA